jgi:pimeloyl-ACP methyl ester carboxylesterase
MSASDYAILRRRLYQTGQVSYKITLTEQRLTRVKQNGRFVEKLTPITKQAEVYTGYSHAETRISFATAPVIDSLKQVRVPVLVFKGTRHCEITDWGDHYAELLPHTELCKIAGACHEPWLSNPEEFFRRSKSFITKVHRQ